jgi:hypothetical protein
MTASHALSQLSYGPEEGFCPRNFSLLKATANKLKLFDVKESSRCDKERQAGHSVIRDSGLVM